jgi:hypothetical protein
MLLITFEDNEQRSIDGSVDDEIRLLENSCVDDSLSNLSNIDNEVNVFNKDKLDKYWISI